MLKSYQTYTTKQSLTSKHQHWRSLITVDDLAKLLKFESHKLQLIAADVQYNCFTIKKTNGKDRLIEAPKPPLDRLLKSIQHYLQCCYFYKRTKAAYGFIISQKGDKEPRNIVTNAAQHLNKSWLINIDLKDFFHQVGEEEVYKIFTNHFPYMNSSLAKLLTTLCCFNGRVPMGASTSPVLSNFAFIKCDEAISKWCNQNQITYTRYADDLAFSCNEPLYQDHIKHLISILLQHNFVPNKNKIKLFSPADTKEITGLVVNDSITIPNDFYNKLGKNILQIKHIYIAKNNANANSKYKKQHAKERWLKQLHQQIEGKLAFIEFVLGSESDRYQHHLKKYLKAIEPTQNQLQSYSWLDFPYGF